MITTFKHTAIAAVATFAFSAAAQADNCPFKSDLVLSGAGAKLGIARPDGQEMCVTLPKSAGVSAGRVTVVSVRPFLRASSSEIEVTATKERTRNRGQAAHVGSDFSIPELLGGAQMFISADDDTHMTIRVKPRHREDYRLALVVHEIDIAEVLGQATMEALGAMAFSEFMIALFGTDKATLPFLDERAQQLVMKSVIGKMRGHTKEQIGIDVTMGMILKEVMVSAEVPRPVRIAALTFLSNVWREVSRGAFAQFEWSIPDHVRDTSQPVIASR